MQKIIELLTQLQDIDLAIDTIENKKGSLPKELAKLQEDLKKQEEEQKRIEEEEIKAQKEIISQQKEISKKASDLLVQYKQDHLNAVHNKDEYDNITQEIALQELDIKLAKKKAKIAQEHINRHKERVGEIKKLIEENQALIKLKQQNLAKITEETQAEEANLATKRLALTNQLQDTDFLKKYETLRNRFNLVVANVIQEACNGCFIIVPTQRQIKIREQKTIFMCENCGRMLVKAEKVVAAEEAPKKIISSRRG